MGSAMAEQRRAGRSERLERAQRENERLTLLLARMRSMLPGGAQQDGRRE